MNNSQARERIKRLRKNLKDSATPNMMRAITNKAPIAALVYGLALIDMLAGFFYGAEAKNQIKRQSKRGDGVGIRYEKFVEEYMSPARSGCDYRELDLYKSLRCNMAHSLTPGHLRNGKYKFLLVEGQSKRHGEKIGSRRVIFDVPTFCDDVLAAADGFLKAVKQSTLIRPEPLLLKNFKSWWNEGYSVLVSVSF